MYLYSMSPTSYGHCKKARRYIFVTFITVIPLPVLLLSASVSGQVDTFSSSLQDVSAWIRKVPWVMMVVVSFTAMDFSTPLFQFYKKYLNWNVESLKTFFFWVLKLCEISPMSRYLQPTSQFCTPFGLFECMSAATTHIRVAAFDCRSANQRTIKIPF